MSTAQEREYQLIHSEANAGESHMIIGTIIGIIALGIVLSHIPTEENMLEFLLHTPYGRFATFLGLLGFVLGVQGFRKHWTNRGIQSVLTRR